MASVVLSKEQGFACLVLKISVPSERYSNGLTQFSALRETLARTIIANTLIT